MKTVIDQINKIYDKFNKLNEWFIIFLMSAMCLDLLGQVIMRYVFQHPLTWSEELARYIFVWIALLGSAWCGRNHIPCPYDSSDIPASEAGCPCDPDPHQHYLRRDMFHPVPKRV